MFCKNDTFMSNFKYLSKDLFVMNIFFIYNYKLMVEKNFVSDMVSHNS
jgi:hypothetical protein